MSKKKKKKASKAVRTPKKPILVNLLLDGKIICRIDVSKRRESEKEVGKNCFNL